jgi:ketosteroid isomerase-like protein
LTYNWQDKELNIANHIQRPVRMNTNMQFHDFNFAITRGYHTQTQDGHEGTLKAAFVVPLDQCVKCIFLHYRRN